MANPGYQAPRPHKVKDMTGLRFGRLVVLGLVPPERTYQAKYQKRAWWACQCDCGQFHFVRGNDLRAKSRPGTKSCGCGRTGRPKKQRGDAMSDEPKSPSHHAWVCYCGLTFPQAMKECSVCGAKAPEPQPPYPLFCHHPAKCIAEGRCAAERCCAD